MFSSVLLLANSSGHWQPINLFISTADQRYGPITTIRRDGRILKHIPWTAFTITKNDWDRVKEVSEILAVSLNYIDFTIAKTDIDYRIPIVFSNTSRQRSGPLSGGLFWQLKSSKRHGRRNATAPDSPSTVMLSTMALQSSTITIHASTRNQHLYWHLVCSRLCSVIALSDTQLTALHPYYKLSYIELVWGGAKEQEAE